MKIYRAYLLAAVVGVVGIAAVAPADKIRLFNTWLAAMDITGSKSFGPSRSATTSPLIKDPLRYPGLEYMLGKAVGKRLREPDPLFDLDLSAASLPLLDSIDLYFYENFVFPNEQTYLPDLSPTEKQSLESLKAKITASGSIAEKKKALFTEPIRFRLFRSKMDTIPFEFKRSDILKVAYVNYMGAKLDSLALTEKVKLTAGARAEFSGFVNKNVAITGRVLEVNYSPHYLAIVKSFITSFKKNASKYSDLDDPFTQGMRDLIEGKGNRYVITGAALIPVETKYTGDANRKAAIEAVLKADVGLTDVAAVNVAAALDEEFTRLIGNSAQSRLTYVVKYGYSLDLYEVLKKP